MMNSALTNSSDSSSNKTHLHLEEERPQLPDVVRGHVDLPAHAGPVRGRLQLKRIFGELMLAINPTVQTPNMLSTIKYLFVLCFCCHKIEDTVIKEAPLDRPQRTESVVA